MITLAPPPDIVLELEEALNLDSAVRVSCEPTFNGVPILEPRIVPFQGWNIDHTWEWKPTGVSCWIDGCQYEIFGSKTWYATIRIRPTQIYTEHGLTIIAGIQKG